MLPVLPIEKYGVARVDIHKYGVARVAAPYISMVLPTLPHREVWCCPCCPIEKYGVARVAP